jgi:apolipoprotein D and lipocalin family protein
MKPFTRLALMALFAAGCAGAPPIPAVEPVDIPRFMGDWYVLGHIPADAEEKAWNAVESYRLRPGTRDVVETTFVFREGSFEAPLVRLEPVGYVEDGAGGRWGMKFFWWQGPIRFEYLVAWLDADYTRTIIARSARDYVWIMARSPELPAAQWDELVAAVAAMGYDTGKLRRVPQRWGVAPDLSPAERAAAPATR